MLGRDKFEERGNLGSYAFDGSISSRENELLGQATQCVRKFAPHGRKRMRRMDNGHITACRISDANPNEMIVSWSGDYIYSFDLARTPDATEYSRGNPENVLGGHAKDRMRESTDRKRKRNNQNSTTSADAASRSSKARQLSKSAANEGDLSIRVRYENGQSEDLAMEDTVMSVPSPIVEDAKESILSESQKRSLQIAKIVVKIRRLTFSLDIRDRDSAASAGHEHITHTALFTSILGFAATCLPEIDDIISSWRYPIDPHREDVVFEKTLRSNREATRRFVQAAGTLAKLLGGRLQTAGRGRSHALQYFQQLGPAPIKGPYITQTQVFSHEFLKAIILWLDGGTQALLQGFKRPENQRLNDPRFPVPDEAQVSGIDDYVIPYLLRLAQGNFIPNVDVSRFGRDEERKLFETETAAVIAFNHAILMPLEDLSKAVTAVTPSPSERPLLRTQHRTTAMNFWGFKVGRSMLMTTSKGINFQFVDTAFGGLGTCKVDEGRLQEDISPDEIDDVVESIGVVKRPPDESVEGLSIAGKEDSVASFSINEDLQQSGSCSPSVESREPIIEGEDTGSDADFVLMEDIHNEIAHHIGEGYEENYESDEDEDEDEDEDGDREDDDDDDDEITAAERQLLFQSASDRGKLRESVEKDVACSSHTRQYRGHCNVKTVKDANFFGLQDEYVVSGSDSGHVFIWDKKTSELVNILEGDGEVVNVVQGTSISFRS